MTKPKKAKKKKAVSWETRQKRLKQYRANLSDDKKQKIREYNRIRSKIARSKETPLDREKRLQRSREQAHVRRTKRKQAVVREMRRMGLIPPKGSANANGSNQIDVVPGNVPTPSQVVVNPALTQQANAFFNTMNAAKKNNVPQMPVKLNNNQRPPGKVPLPYINYRPSFPMNVRPGLPVNMNEEYYDEMATVCPIECNVDIGGPSQPGKNNNLKPSSSNEQYVKNISAQVVLKKKVPSRPAGEEFRIRNGNPMPGLIPRAAGDWNGGGSDWNGLASVCPIECNVDISEPSEPLVLPKVKNNPDPKRNNLLDTLKQMGTCVTIKKKPETASSNNSVYKSLNSNIELTRLLPPDCNVDIKPVKSNKPPPPPLKQLSMFKRNGNNNNSHISKLGSQIVMQRVSKPPPMVPIKNYESPDEEYDDYDMMPLPVECNVDISESS